MNTFKLNSTPTMGLNQTQIQHMIDHKPILERAQLATGVPWQAIAAVWYRESFSVEPPKTPGGPYQFDPIPADAILEDLLRRFTNLRPDKRLELIKKGVNDFEAGAIFCACWLRRSCRALIVPTVADVVIADAFYGYNGRKYGSIDRSPYVVNGIDEAHHRMHISGTIPDAKCHPHCGPNCGCPKKPCPPGCHGARIWIDTHDERPGALVVYRQLKRLGI